MKYIDADKLIAEIERQILDARSHDWHISEKYCEEILYFVHSLQREQPEQDITEFEKALDSFGEAYATLVDRDNNPNQGIRINAYHELVRERINEILSLAKEYIKQERPEADLEKEIQSFWNANALAYRLGHVADINFLAYTARHFYELGLNAKKG